MSIVAACLYKSFEHIKEMLSEKKDNKPEVKPDSAGKEPVESTTPQISEQEKKQAQALTEKLSKILKTAANVFNREIPASGKTDGHCVVFNIHDRFVKEWQLTVTGHHGDNERILSLGAYFPDDDRYARPMAGYTMSQCIFIGTKQEILDYLVSPECVDKIVKTSAGIDKSIQEHE